MSAHHNTWSCSTGTQLQSGCLIKVTEIILPFVMERCHMYCPVSSTHAVENDNTDASISYPAQKNIALGWADLQSVKCLTEITLFLIILLLTQKFLILRIEEQTFQQWIYVKEDISSLFIIGRNTEWGGDGRIVL